MITQFSAQIDSAKANNDRTLSLKIDTQELVIHGYKETSDGLRLDYEVREI